MNFQKVIIDKNLISTLNNYLTISLSLFIIEKTSLAEKITEVNKLKNEIKTLNNQVKNINKTFYFFFFF